MVLSSPSPAARTPTHRAPDSADLVSAHAALLKLKEALERTIFGQSRMIDLALITLLAGGMRCSSACRGLPRRGSWKLWRHRAGSAMPVCKARPISCPPTFWAPKSSISSKREVRASSALCGADLHPASAVRRNQPREPAHPGGPFAGDAGTQGHNRRDDARAAQTLSRLCHTKPD